MIPKALRRGRPFFKARPTNDQRGARSLIESRQYASRFIEETAVATFVLDADGRVIVWNEACERLTGLAAGKVLGTKDHWQGFYKAARPCLADLALADGKAKVGQLYAAQGQGAGEGGKLRAENWCDLPRGARLYLAIDACPVRDEKGAV